MARVLTSLELWPQWCPGVSHARLEGPLSPGQTGSLHLAMPVVGAVHRWTGPPLRVVEVVPQRRLVTEQPPPRGNLRITWELRDRTDGLCELTQELAVQGPLSVVDLDAGARADQQHDGGLSPVAEVFVSNALHV
jgi:hypothetical protein